MTISPELDAAAQAALSEIKEMEAGLADRQALAKLARTCGALTAPELAALELPEPSPVVDGLIYPGLSLLAGKPKLGKSFWALNVALGVASGGPVLGELECSAGEVLYLALEDGPRRLKTRQAVLLAGDDPPPGLIFATDWPRLDDGGLDQLATWLQARPMMRLVFVDTLARVRAPASKGTQYELDYNALADLQSLANENSAAIVTVTHTREAEADDFIDKVSGTAGLTGAADAVLVMSRSRGEADARLQLVGRDLEERDLALDFDKKTGLWTILGEGDEFRLSKERKDILDYLKAIRPESAWPREIAEGTGKPDKTGSIKHLLAKLTKAGLVARGDRGYYAEED